MQSSRASRPPAGLRASIHSGFTGKPLDGVPRTDAGWFTRDTRKSTPARPPEAIGAEARADPRGLLAEWRELRVRRWLGREWRETERRVVSEPRHGPGTP